MANRAFPNFGKSYENVTMPARITMQFSVAAADTGGLGITGLKSNGYIKNVFMHTSATPATDNPNPAAGYIVIQLADNYIGLLNATIRIQSPVTGSELSTKAADTALTVGVPYQITTLGTTTAANWKTLGLPAGMTAALGQVFIAAATGAGTGTGKVKALTPSTANTFEILGQTGTQLGPQGVTNQGGYVYGQFIGPTSSSVTTQIPVNPADGSLVMITLEMENSSATVDGL